MSRVLDHLDVSLIDAFLRDQLDEDATESFELRMLGDADFALVVAQRRAMLDAVDRLPVNGDPQPDTTVSKPLPRAPVDEGAGAAAALLSWFAGPAWSGVATAGFALCAVLLALDARVPATVSEAAAPRLQTFEHELLLHSVRSMVGASVPETEPFLLVVEAIDAEGAVSARLDGPEVIDIEPIVVGEDGFVRIMVDRLAVGAYGIELRDAAGQTLIAYGFEVSAQD